MNAPNRSSEVAAWMSANENLFRDHEGMSPDDVRRGLLVPLCQHLNRIEGRNVWGRLVKTDRTPAFVPHDIIVWRDTRQHFDVFTGTEHVEDTEPTWGENPPPDNPAWLWQDVGAVVPEPGPEPGPEPEPQPEPEPDPALEQRVAALEADVRSLQLAYTQLSQRVTTLETAQPPALPELIAEGNTGRVFGHAHPVSLKVRKA